MSVATTTLQVNFVSESAANANTFGWYNSVTGLGGVLFADVESDGKNAPLTAGVSTATFTVNTADLGNIQFFLIPDGADHNSSSELSGPVKVVQLSNGTWAVAQATASGSVVLDHGQPNVLAGAGVNAMFTETSKNAGGVDYASSVVGSTQTAATLAGDTADGATGLLAWEDLAATRNANGTYSKPGDADYNDAVFKISIKPAANADTATVSENGPATAINVLANDTDQATGAMLHVSSVNTSGLHGTVTIAADGSSISYNPGSYFQYLAAGQTATETFTYTATDQFGGSATASTTVTIVGANDGPTIASATATGAVTEDDNTTASGTIAFKDVDATDTHTISVVAGGSGYLGSFTPTLRNDSTGDGSGSVAWNFAVANNALQFLAAGQTVTQTYTVTINDGHGGTASQNVTVTITGSNDGPCVSCLLGFGAVTDNGSLTTTGTIGFSDVDVTDVHTVTATALGSGYVGTLTPVVTAESAGGSGSIDWTYSVASADIDFLGAGQTAYQIYKVTVNDGHGGTDSQYVTITLNGSNDAPVVTASTNGSVTEIADNATGENTATLTSNGTVTFVDPDWTDTHTVTVTPQASGYRGTFAASLYADANTAHGFDHDADDVGPGTVKWNFAVNDSSLDFLSAGQTLVQNYNVTIKDNHGASVTQVVSVTLVGTNDAPTITSAVTTGAVNELPDGAPGEYLATLSSSGTIGFKDVDLADSHVISVTPAAAGYVGALTAVTSPDSTGTGAGTVSWTYSVRDGTIDYLAAGQKLTQTYTVAIDDGHGGVASKAVTITITGAADVNHAPVIGAGVTSGAIVEDGVVSAAGAISFGDTDLNDTHTVTAVAGGVGYLGTFTPVVSDDTTGDGSGSVNWTFAADNATLQFLGAGQTLTQTYTVSVNDGQGGTASKLVTVTITGTNDVPVIGGVAMGSVTEDAGVTSGNLVTGGALTIADVDQGQSNFAAQAGTASTYGTFTLATNGAWTYTANDGQTAIQQLGAGQSITDSFTAVSSDGTASQVVTVTINGTNDVPVIGGVTIGSITEDVGALGGNLSTSGALTIADVDQGQSNFAAQAGTVATYGTFTLASNGAWTYTANDGQTAIQQLGAGQSITDSFTAVSSDGTASQVVTVTINGTNDVPVIGGVAIGSVTEDVGALGGNLSTSGALTIADVDQGQSNFAAQASAVATYGTFTLATNGAWTYTANDGQTAIQQLGAGQSITDSFTAVSSDGTASQVVTVTINGTNDVPVIGGVAIGSVTEDIGVVSGNLVSSGALTIADVDQGQSNFAAQAGTVATYGTFTLASNGAWTYTAGNSHAAIQQLGAGQSITDSFTAVSSDGTAGQLVTVTINGTNDVPVIGGATIGPITEDVGAVGGNLSTSGALTIADVDQGQSNFAAQAGTVATYGTFTLASNGAWTYTANDGQTAIQQLGAGQSITDSFTAVSSDGTASQVVTVTINGTNDVPVIGGVTIGSVTEDIGAVGGNLSTSGALTIADVDQGQSNFLAQASTTAVYGTFTLATNGAWTYAADDSQTAIQQLGAGQSITDSFTAVSSDGTASQVVTVTINGTNDVPVIGGATIGSVTEDVGAVGGNLSTSGALTIADVDQGQSNFAAQAAAAGTYGTFTLAANGAWTYTADDSQAAVQQLGAGQSITDSFTAVSSDGTASQVVTVTINGTNDVPVIGGVAIGSDTEDVGVVSSHLSTNGALTIADVDQGQSNFAAQAGTVVTYGTFTLAANGVWTYTADNSQAAVQQLGAGQSITDSFTAVSSDGTASQLVTVTINGTNDVPVIGGVTIGSVAEDIGVVSGNLVTSGALTIADVDQGQSNFTAQAGTAGTYGTFTLSAAGAWTYAADDTQTAIQQLGAGQSISDSFTAVSSDGTASQLVTVTINGTNDVPVIGGASTGSVTEDVGVTSGNLVTSGALTIADVDQGQSSFTAQAATAGTYGTFTLAANGAWTYTAGDGQTAIQQLGAGQSITDSFTAVSADGTASQVVAVTINGTNDVPIISGVSTGSVTEDVAVVSNALSTGGTLTIADVDQGQSNFLAQAGTAAAYGTFTLNAAGAWTYTADDSQTAIQQLGAGQSITDSFTAVSSDGTASQVVTVTIDGTNDVPVISGVAVGSVTEDAGVSSGNLVTSGALSIADVDQGQSNFIAQSGAVADYGTFTLTANGNWTYTANDSQTAIQQLGAGQSITDSFTAVSSDGTASKVVTVTINGTNDVPVIGGVSTGSVTEDVALTGSNLTTNGSLTIADVDQGQSNFAAQAGTVATYGTFTLAANGNWTYTANDSQTAIQQLGVGQSITDSFTAVSSDGSASRIVTVTINGTNDVPAISGVSTGSVTEDVALTGSNLTTNGTLSIADVDQGQSNFTAQAGAAGSYGTFTLAANGAWTYTANNSQTAIQQLGAGQSITDSFTAVSSDGTASQVVTVTIHGTNDVPVIGGVSIGSVTEDVGLTGSNLTTNGTLTIADVDQGQSNFAAQSSTAANYGTFTLAANGAWTYTANDSQTAIQQLGAGQSITDGFTAVSSDGSASKVVTVTINGTNDVPVIGGVSIGLVTEDVGLTGSNLTTNGTLTIADVDQGQSNFAPQASAAGSYGTFTLAANGGWTYTGSDNQTAIQQLGAGQSITDSFTAVSSDGTASKVVTVTINGTNDVPVISGVSIGSVTEDVGLTGSNLTTNGTLTIADVDQGQSNFTAQAGTVATYGTFALAANGNWTYTANDSQTAIQQLGAGQSITDSFTAVSSDGTASQVITVTIHGTNDVPVIGGVSLGSVTEDFSLTGSNLTTSGALTVADADQGQSNFAAQAGTVATYGTFTLAANGNWTYTANDNQTAIQQLGAGQSITDSFTAVSSDGTASQVVTVTIHGTNDVPVIGGVSTGSVTEDVGLTGSNLTTSGTLSIADVDQGQSNFAAQAGAVATYGTFTLATNGAWTYAASDSQIAIQQLGAGQSITDSFTAVSSDGTASQVVTVTIHGTNDVPVIGGVSLGSVTEDSGVTGGNLVTGGALTIADVDQGQSNFAAQAGTVATYGTFTLATNGAWTYTAGNNQTAIQQLGSGQSITDSFIAGSSDGTASQVVTVTIHGTNDVPVISGVSIGSVTEDVGLTGSNLVTNGTLTIADVDQGQSSFVAQAGTVATYGTFTLAANGAWTYTAGNSQTAIQQLGAGQSITDSFTAVSSDSTASQVVTVTIHGTNDVPVISGVSTGSVTEDVGLTGSNLVTNGMLTIADVDQGQSNFTAQASAAGSYGTFTLAANGAWTYTASDSQTAIQQLGAGQSITDSFTAVSSDGTASQVVTVTIHGTNDVPMISGVSTGSVTEDVGLTGSNLVTNGTLTIADVDQGQSNFTAQASAAGSYGTFTLAANGAWTYTASDSQTAIQQLGAGQSITDSFTAVSSDGTASQVVTVTIHGTNDVPVIGGVSLGSVTEDSGVSSGNLVTSGALTIADADQGQSNFAAQAGTVATYGTFTLTANGNWTYTANDSQTAIQQLGSGQSITDSFIAGSSDGTASQVVTVTIHGTNDVPVISGVSSGSVTEDVALTGSNLSASGTLTIADVDQGQSSFAPQASAAGSYGTFTLAANGNWTYTANDSQAAVQQLGAGQSITDSFTAVSSDGTANRVVTVTINGTNDVPVISGVSSGSVTEDAAVVSGNLVTSGALTIADVDQGQSSFAVQVGTAATYGTFTLATNGAWTYTANDSQTAIQQLGAGQSITDSFMAVSSDGTASKVVTVTINGTNDVPVIAGVSTGSVTEDVALTGSNLTTNGTLTIADVDQGQSSFAAQSSTAATYGTFTLAANGAWTYTANDSQTAIQQLGAGQSITDGFTAVSSDGSASKVVTVTINGTNDVPVIGGVSIGSVTEDVGLTGSNLTTNGTLTIADVDQGQSSFAPQVSVAGSYGIFTLAANGNWTYTANNSQIAIQQLGVGQSITDSFTAFSSDGTASRVVAVTINGTNDVPVISGVPTGSVTEDTALTGSNLAASGTLTIADVDLGQSSFAPQASAAGSYGTFTLAANGNWTYTANDSQTAIQQLGAGQSIADSFTAVSSDGTASRVVTVTINGTNDVPLIGGASTGSVTEDVALTGSNLTTNGSLTIADIDQGQSNFAPQAGAAGSYGTFTLATNGAWTYASSNSQTAIQQLGAGQSITDSFTAVSADGTASRVVTVTINGTNDVPVIGGVSTGSVTEDIAAVSGNLTTSGGLTIADVDQGQSSFVAQAGTVATYGTFTLAANGTWTYTANDSQTAVQQLGAGQSITDSFTAVSSDGTASKVVTVTINGTNDVPVISGVSTGSVTEDVGLTGSNLTANGALTITDVDQGQSNFIAQASTTATYGTFTLTTNGAWTYVASNSQTAIQQLGSGQSITDSFTAVSSDGTASRIVTVTINGTNDVPVIGGTSTGSVTEDVGLTGSNLTTSGALTIADVDQGQSSFAAQASTAATYGTFTLATTGAWTYTANNSQTAIQQLGAGQSITDGFTAVSSDGTASRIVTVTINGTNDVPVIGGTSTGSVTEDAGLIGSNLTTSGALTIADVDQGQSTFVAQSSTAATYGTFTLATNGAWTYVASNSQTAIQQLGSGQSITDSFTAVSSDGTASRIVTVTINGTNDVPVIGGTSTGSVTEDVGLTGSNLATSGTLTIADVDQGQSSFAAQASTAATYGTFTLATNGAWTYTANNSQTAIQQLGAGQSIADSFTVVSSDGTASKVVTVTINGTNDVPVIGGTSTGSVTEDVGLTGSNLTTSGALTIADVDQGQSSFTAQTSAAGSYGTFTLATNGAWTYAANDSQTAIQQLGTGQSITDSFTAVSSDGSASRIVTVTINGTNDVPLISGASTGSVTEDIAVVGGNLNTSGTLTIADVDQGQSSFTAQAGTTGSNGYGSFTLAANGNWTYTANDSQTAIQQLGAGQSLSDSFTAVSSDGTASRLVTVTINGTNDVPVIGGVSTGSVTEDVGVVSGNLAASGTLTITDTDQGQSSFTARPSVAGSYGNFTLAANGSWTYAASDSQTAVQQLGNGQSITDGFTAVSSDGSASQIVTVTIHGTNDVPVISGVSSGSVIEDTSVSGGNLATGGALTIADVDQGQSNFTVQAGTTGSNGYGTFTLAANGNWTYAANDSQTAIQQLGAGQSITDSFTAVSSDGSASRLVTVTINGTNDVPVIGGVSTGSVTEDLGVVSGNLATNGTLTIIDADQGQSSFVAQAGTAATYGTFTLATNGTWTYAANDSQTAIQQLGAGQSITDSFTAVSSDGTASKVVTVTINGANDVPVISGVSTNAVTEDVGVSGGNLATGGALTISDVDQGQSSFIAQAGAVASYGTFTLAANGAWTYAASDSQTAIQQLGAGQSLTDSFTAVSSDGTASRTVTVTINGTNDVPVIAGVSAGSVTEDVGVVSGSLVTSGALTISDVDQGQSNFTAQAGTAGSNGYGIFTLAANGAWTYTADDSQTAIQTLGTGQSITDSFTAVSSDGTASRVVTVTINGTNDAPVAVNDAYASDEDTTLVVNAATGMLANDTDVDTARASLTASVVSGPSHGTLTSASDGSFTYTPTANYNGTDSFTYKTSDGSLDSTAATVTLTINPVNDGPVNTVPSAVQTVAEDTNLSITGLSVSDIDAGSASITTTLSAVHGTLTVASAGGAAVAGSGTATVTLTGSQSQINATLAAANNVVYRGLQDYNGGDNVTIVTNDGGNTGSGGALTATSTVAITVTAVNDAPVNIVPTGQTSQLNIPKVFSTTNANAISISDVDAGAGSETVTLSVLDGTLTLSRTTGLTFTSGNGTANAGMTFSGTVSNINAALNGMTYTPTTNFLGTDTLTITSNDNGNSGSGGALTDTDTMSILSYQTFQNPVTFSVTASSNPEWIVPTDLNGDGKLDLVIANFALNGVSVLLGNGNGTFGSPTNYPIPTSSSSWVLALADFNGDGKQDIAVTDQTNNQVDILLGNSNGTFGAYTSYAVGSAAKGIVARDFNGDGKLDLAVANTGNSNVSILLGNGNGTFGAATNFTVGTSPLMIAAGDFNGDGKLDLVTTNQDSNNLSLLLGNGNGTFGTATNFAVGAQPRGIATGDFNGDGKLDVVTSNVGSNTISVLLGNGTGSFAPAVSYAVGSGPVALAVADFNGDGKSDIAITNGGGGTITLLFGNGNGTFAGRADFTIGNTPRGIAVADYNGDGKADILVANLNSDSLSVLLHNPTAPGPAGVAGHAIGLGLSDMSDMSPTASVTVSGVPTGWSLNIGTDLGNGTWNVGASDLGNLAVTAPGDFAGAMVLNVTESWQQSDGTPMTISLDDNVEVYQGGSPIFAWANQDWLTGSGGNDLFVFAQPIGNDTIYNFNAASDRIDLIGFDGMANFQDVLAHTVSDPNGDAVINLGSGETITLLGVDQDSLAAGNFAFDQMPVTTNSGSMQISNGATLPLDGTIDNSGTIALNSTGDATNLQIGAGVLTLQGGGNLTLSDSDQNYVDAASGAATLVNADNTISGAGHIGDGSLTLVNDGTINATGTNALVIDTGSNTIVNHGTLEANGGTLAVQSDVSGGGNAVINGGTLEFGGASDVAASFGAGTVGTLRLDQSSSFSGTVAGLDAGDTIDFADFMAGSNATLGYTANADGSGGTLSVGDGTHAARIALLGNYMASSFVATSDGHGGTSVVDTQPASQGLLVPPQHA